MTSSASVQLPSPFSPGSDADASDGWTDAIEGRGGDTVIKPILSPTASPVIDAAMLCALELARTADEAGEAPVGAAVPSPEGVVLTEVASAREAEHDSTTHVEICALRAVDTILDDSHLGSCTLVVTPEPCTMCAGTVVLARVAWLTLEAWESRAGVCDSVRDVVRDTRANHQAEVRAGLRAQGSQELLAAFFTDRR